MEKLITKDILLKLILESKLGFENNLLLENELLVEMFSSVEDPEFKSKEQYYTRFKPLALLYTKLNDSQKLNSINKIESIVNGGSLGNARYEAISPNNFLANCLAAEYVASENPNADKTAIFNFLIIYYSPYSSNGELSPAAYKAIPNEFKEYFYGNRDIDVIVDAYYDAIDYFLKENHFKPELGLFDYVLFQQKWKSNIIDYYRGNKTQTFSSTQMSSNKAGGDDYENPEITDILSAEDKPYEVKDNMTDKDKFNYILTHLNRGEKELLSAWYTWYSDLTNNDATEKIVDVATAGGDSLDVIAPEGSGSDDFYAKIGNLLGKDYGATKTAFTRLREKLKELSNDPKFKSKLDLDDYRITQKKILQAVSSAKGKKKKFDETLVLKYVNKLFESYRKDVNSTIKIFNKIEKVKSILNEGHQVGVIDLDQDIYNFIDRVVDRLAESNEEMHDMYRIHKDTQYDYPLVAQKIAEFIEPLIEELSTLTNKVIKVKSQMTPFLRESVEKKNFNLDEDDMNEERITNPESKIYVKDRQNFIGSHVYGEDLGDLGKMYACYSYGEQYPAYVWYNDKWYHNTDDYYLENGEVNEPTEQHLKDMKPSDDTHGLSTIALQTMISKFKKKYGIGDNAHKDVEPGVKN